jgi:hypothetical protein
VRNEARDIELTSELEAAITRYWLVAESRFHDQLEGHIRGMLAGADPLTALREAQAHQSECSRPLCRTGVRSA